MTRIINFFQTIRNNWKKSIFGAAALSFGVSYSIDKYDKHQLMRECCKEAAKFGNQTLPVNTRARQMIVILNPVANKRKAKKLFEKYCEPLLHLAGIAVQIIQTDPGSQTYNVLSKIDSPIDGVIVAGGDGTLSEVITELMRKHQRKIAIVKQYPVGILPLGQKNTIASSLYHNYENLKDVRPLIEATMAIIRGNTVALDVIEVEPLEQDPENIIKPVYALGAIEWGAWKDANARIDKYWYYGYLKKYFTYVFNGYKKDLSWHCNATLKYTEPCNGCSRCYKEIIYSNRSATPNERWWHAFLSRKKNQSTDNDVDYSKIINENCANIHEISISTTELHIKTINTDSTQSKTKSLLNADLGPKDIDYFAYVAEGWRRTKGNGVSMHNALQAKSIELYPENTLDKNEEIMFYIDDEKFELRPLRINLLPKSINVYCPESKR